MMIIMTIIMIKMITDRNIKQNNNDNDYDNFNQNLLTKSK